ncbi:MAG: MarR family winged helix-turn-helix transcriptional regulator [Sphingopyxis sp.]
MNNANWMTSIINIVRSDLPDLTNRQMGIMLSVGLSRGPHTVRGLAERIGVSKPVVTRALNKLTALGYLQRQRDCDDGRNIFIEMTDAGAEFLDNLNQLIGSADRDHEPIRRPHAVQPVGAIAAL